MSSSGSDLLGAFRCEKLIHQDARSHTVNLLGTITLPSRGWTSPVPALALLTKTHFETADPSVHLGATDRVEGLGANDVYNWMHGWVKRDDSTPPDWKATLIVPATDVHIRKYSMQTRRMVSETAALYQSVVRPYIESIPPSRINWVYNILDHQAESERIIYEDPDPTQGFLILPDLKWDQKTLASLYLVCLVHDRTLRSIRDLRPVHLPLLRAVAREAGKAAKHRYGVGPDELRMFFHYQPSYYHLHIHITHIAHEGFAGITVGQAHLLQDVMAALEFEGRFDWPGSGSGSFFATKTFTYSLGDGHALYEPLVAAASSP